MSTQRSPFNPSRQVERIREILVGRELASVERRLDRLENQRTPVNGQSRPPTPEPAATLPPDAVKRPEIDRLKQQIERKIESEADQRRRAASAMAARIQEALQRLGEQIDARPSAAEFDERIGTLRSELRQDIAQLEAELRENSRHQIAGITELAERVTRLAAQRESGPQSQTDPAALARLQASLEDWQRRMGEYLKSRERWLIGELRGELQRLRSETWHWLGELHRTKVDRSEFEARLPRETTRPAPPTPWRPPSELSPASPSKRKPPP